MKFRLAFSAIALLLASERASGSEVEHWTCSDGKDTQNWTIVDNRMFAPNGKGSLQLLMNTPQVAVSCIELSEERPVFEILVLDKVAGKMLSFDNILTEATVNKHLFEHYADPTTKVENCRRTD